MSMGRATYYCNTEAPRAPALYTYYAVMSLVVVALAISLIWVPIIQLITEVTAIFYKMLIYTNKELFGNSNDGFLSSLEPYFHSQTALVVLSVSCIVYALYLASGDFLMFAGCYVCNLPNDGYLEQIKKFALDIIAYLLTLTGKMKKPHHDENIRINYHTGHH